MLRDKFLTYNRNFDYFNKFASLYRFIRNTGATVMDLLETFESCRPDLATLLEVCPPLVPRQYSLVDECTNGSSQELNFAFSSIIFPFEPQENGLEIEGISFKRYVRHEGVATGYLHRLWKEQQLMGSPTTDLYISLHTNMNKFAHPESLSAPLIMISAGTGVAPFIGFLQQRRRLKQQSSSQDVGESWLFFGCRDPNFDLLFAEDIAGFLEDSTLSHICLCFSRFFGELPAKLPEILRLKAIIPKDCKYIQDCIASSCKSNHSVNEIADKLGNIHISNDPSNDIDISTRMVELVDKKGGHVRVSKLPFLICFEL